MFHLLQLLQLIPISDIILPTLKREDFMQIIECTEKEKEILEDISLIKKLASVGITEENTPAFIRLLKLLKDNDKLEINDSDFWISPNEAAKILGVSRPFLMKLAKEKDFKTKMKNTHNLIFRPDVLNFQVKWDKEQSAQRRKALEEITPAFFEDDDE